MLKNIFLIGALFWTGVILFFCLENAKNIPVIDILHVDKIIHVIFHFVFAILWFLYFKKKFNTSNGVNLLVFTVFVSFVFGIVIELIQQYFTTTRSADILDILANVFGALLAAVLIILVNSYNGFIDKI